MRLGAGLDLNAQINPLVSARQQQSVCSFIEQAKTEGATVLAGGSAADLPGYFVRPTLLAGADHSSTAEREEIFGPVMVVMPFDTAEEAVRLANDIPYGLAASVWSNNLAQVMNVTPQLQAGTVWVNTHRFHSGEDLAQTLERYVWLYNQHLPQLALQHRTPIQAMPHRRSSSHPN